MIAKNRRICRNCKIVQFFISNSYMQSCKKWVISTFSEFSNEKILEKRTRLKLGFHKNYKNSKKKFNLNSLIFLVFFLYEQDMAQENV